MLFFVALFPYFAISSDDTAASARRAGCLLPPTCLALGTVAFSEFEDSGEVKFSHTFSLLLRETSREERVLCKARMCSCVEAVNIFFGSFFSFKTGRNAMGAVFGVTSSTRNALVVSTNSACLRCARASVPLALCVHAVPQS